MAGCACERKNELYEDIEKNTAKNIATQSHVSIDIAMNRAKKIVSDRKEVDERYRENDERGVEGKGPTFEFTRDGDVYFPEFNGYLGNMYKDQIEVRPQEYHLDEHNTVLSAYESLKHGATQSAHIVHHYNEQGQLDIRDVVILTYDQKTNTGTMHIINISKDGKNHQSLESAQSAMKERLDGFTEEKKSNGVFLFVREESSIDPISLFQEKKGAQEKLEKSGISPKYSLERDSQKLPDMQPRKDVLPIIRPVFRADDKKNTVPFTLPSYLQRLMGRDEKGNVIHKEQLKISKQKDSEKQNKKHEKKIADIIQNIEKQKGKINMGKWGIKFSEKTGVGIGGALKFLEDMNQPVMQLTKKEKQVFRKRRKEMRKGMRKEMHGERTKKNKGKTYIEGDIRRKNDRVMSKQKQEKNVMEKDTKKRTVSHEYHGLKKEKRKKMKERLGIIFSLKEKRSKPDKKEKKNREMAKIMSRERALVLFIRKLTRSIRNESIRTVRKKEKKMRKGKKEMRMRVYKETRSVSETRKKHKKENRMATMEYVRGFLIFLLLRQSLQTRQPDRISENVRSKNMQHEDGEQYVMEHIPWVLLSIIWYMTAIREHGKGVVPPKKKKMKKKRTEFSTNGIIYRYPMIAHIG